MNGEPDAVIAIRPATTADAAWIAAVMDDDWGGPTIWADGRLHDALALPALIAGDRKGVTIYDVAGRRAELLLLHGVRPLAAELERRGWRVFWDWRIPAGKSWRSHLGTRLESTRCVIVVWSEHAAA